MFSHFLALNYRFLNFRENRMEEINLTCPFASRDISRIVTMISTVVNRGTDVHLVRGSSGIGTPEPHCRDALTI